MLAPCHPSSLSAPPPPTLMHTQHMWLNEIQTKGKTEKRKDLPGCLCLCMGVCVCVCVSVGTCVCICGVSRWERFSWVFGSTCRLGSGWKAASGIRLCTHRLGVGERVGSGFLTQKPLPPRPPIPSPTYPPHARQVACPTSLSLSWPLTWLFEGGGGWAENCLKFLEEMQAFPSPFKKS